MEDNEKLIEEARKWGPESMSSRLIRRLADALEAAEKAHTPTDDEREALIQVVSDAFSGYVGAEPDEGDQLVADLILAAGFRRSEPQGEPSDAQVRAAWDFLGSNATVHLDFEDLRAALRAAGGVR